MNLQDQVRKIQEQITTNEKLWGFAGFEPNDPQREAILHEDGPLYITAGPGSGKTRVLLWRVVNLIVFHSVRPGEIFLSTFTEKAAHQLKEGLRSYLGIVTNYNGVPYDLSSMYIGTVHSLCRKILNDRKRFPVDRNQSRAPVLMDELGQYLHIYKNRNWWKLCNAVGVEEEELIVRINSFFGRDSESKHNAVENCIHFFNRLSEEMLEADEVLAKLISGRHDDYIREINADQENYQFMVELYSAYQELLLNSGRAKQTDFSLLQKEAFNRLNQIPESGSVFKHVIVDEYQDTNTIQEKLFFKLSEGSKNLCVVGDDDQALYRFRGATVENFVQFPNRCQSNFNQYPRRINLSINYRSQEDIVAFYHEFISSEDWQTSDGELSYRVEKEIVANRGGNSVAVVASTPGHPDDVTQEIARHVRDIIQEGKVNDPNQIAFLFPSVRYRGNMNVQVERMKEALESPEIGLKVYAPRAGRFLEVDEAYDIFGIFSIIFGVPRPDEVYGYEYNLFMDWLDQVEEVGESLIENDQNLKKFIEDKRAELERVRSDWQLLTDLCQSRRWNLRANYVPSKMKRDLYKVSGLSSEAKKILGSYYLERDVNRRKKEGNPFSLEYVLKRVTSVDWNVLDLFYRICGFDHFRQMIDLAEQGVDEGPICNLGLISEYLSRFMDEYVPIITADLLVDDLFQRLFFLSYLFTLFRLGESEYEDSEDPFPKGRIPFLTIHQAKGLEFPVVVIPNPRKDTHRGPGRVEELVHPFVERDLGEPINRMTDFDKMRMFYVALSRAENHLILGHLRSQGNYVSQPFREMLEEEGFPRIHNFSLDQLPPVEIGDSDLPDSYSFTADFLSYRKCPRQYMVFREYGFVPSRSQTFFFGRLVHQTLDDLHHELIRQREESNG